MNLEHTKCRLLHVFSWLSTRRSRGRYKSFITPHLDYCDIIYHKPSSDELSILDYDFNSSVNPNKSFNDIIESIQYNAAFAITGCIQGTSRDRIYNELGIMSLYDRRNFRRLVFLYKIKKNELLPNYLKLLLPDNQVPTNHSFHNDTGMLFLPKQIS